MDTQLHYSPVQGAALTGLMPAATRKGRLCLLVLGGGCDPDQPDARRDCRGCVCIHEARMAIRVLDPTSETSAGDRRPTPRPAALAGATVGFISNGKEGTAGFFAHLDPLLRERFGVKAIVHRTKANYSAPAEQDIIDEARNWNLAITGLGD